MSGKILFISGLALLAGVFILLLPAPQQGDLRPKGGSRLKNRLAELMVKEGATVHREIENFSFVNKRISPTDSENCDNYNDSFVFQGYDPDQGVGFLTRLGFRDDGELTEVWFWLDVDGKIYYNRDQFFRNDPRDTEGIAKGGVSFRSLKDDEFEIRWSGPMEPAGEQVEVSFTFKGDSAHYLMSEHMDPRAFGMAMAEMKWSREYFNQLRSEGADRYERGGVTTGTVKIGGQPERTVELPGFRDRSWGKRNWLYINRYIWNLVTLDGDLVIDGRAYRYIIYTTADYGTTFSHLVSGWMGGTDGVVPISYASDMTALGEDGKVPREYTTSFRVKDSPDLLTLSVKARPAGHSWLVAEEGFEVNETFAEFEINGIRGQGMQEFGYNLDHYPLGRRKK